MRVEVLGLMALGWGCASAPPPAPPPKPAPPAVVIESLRFVPASRDRLSLQCGRAHAGIELRVALLDARGRELEQREVRAGKVFGGPALIRGSVVRHVLHKAREIPLKVVGRARPRAALRSVRLDAAELTAIKMVSGQSCKRESDGHLACDALADPRIGRSLRLERTTDPGRGTLEFSAIFNRDFERGVVFEARLLDGQGRAHPRCRLRVSQPQVFETQRKRFRLVAREVAVVAALATVKALRVTGHREREAAPDGEQEGPQEVSLFCAPRPRYRPRATIH